jgi:hypothetical protein
MGGRTPFATRLGAPLPSGSAQDSERIPQILGTEWLPTESAHCALRLPTVPADTAHSGRFRGAFSRSTARNHLRALVANPRSPSNTEETGNLGLRFPLPGIVLYLAIPLRSSLRSLVSSRSIGSATAGYLQLCKRLPRLLARLIFSATVR